MYLCNPVGGLKKEGKLYVINKTRIQKALLPAPNISSLTISSYIPFFDVN